jgi:signal transduction histidine kinase
MVLDHGALALAGVRPYAAAILIWCALPITIATGQLSMTGLSVPGVTVAVLALCSRWFAVTHGAITLVWAAAHAVATEALAGWTIAIFLLPAAVVGLVIRHFLVRAAGERERVRRATETMGRVRDQERMALSRELHDAVASGLALISMETASVEDSDDLDEVRGALITVQQVSRATSAELRMLVRTLREPASEATALSSLATSNAGDSLASVTDRITKPLSDRGHPVATDIDGLAEIPTAGLLQSVLHTYLRIVQESVTNIIKHGPPRAPCRIWARATRSTLRFTIANELSPSTAMSRASEDSGRMGLEGIRERAALTSGVVSYGRQGNEWVVEAALPLQPSGLG